MLLELRIKNFLIIEEAHFSFDKGLIVFTGETGAGKSLLVKAIKLLLGEKASHSLLRKGTKEAIVEAILTKNDEEEFHIKRILTPSRQRVYLNGEPITLSELKKITMPLISLVSQYEFYSFFSPENYFTILDTFGNLQKFYNEYKKTYELYQQKLKNLMQLEEQMKDFALKRDFLLFQLKELEEFNPSPEKEKELLKKRETLKNLTILKQVLESIITSLENIENQASTAISNLEKLIQIEETFKNHPFISKFYDFYYENKEFLRELYKYLHELPEDDTELDQIEERLAKYETLKRKYNTTTQGLIEILNKLKQEVSSMETKEENLDLIRKEVEELAEKALGLAKELSQKRKHIKTDFENKLVSILNELGMEKVNFKIKLDSKEPKKENLTPLGLDEIEFLFSSNPGIPLSPLHKTASGGELSRIFLALKTLIQSQNENLTFVFDEIDTGIGGITAKKVGKKLKELSQNSQVICITHLPQIAILADEHYVVEKKVIGDSTVTYIKKLEGEEKLKEIARMLGNPENIELAKNFLLKEFPYLSKS